MVLLYTTEDVDRQIRQWELTNRRENLEQAMLREGMRGLAAQARRRRAPRYLFQWGGYRVFGYLLAVGGRPVLHLCRAFRRGSAEYEGFAYEELGEPEEQASEAWVADELKRIAKSMSDGAVREPEPLPPELAEWLLPPEGVLDDARDLAIYESPEWVRQITRVREAHWLKYRDLVVTVASDNGKGPQPQCARAGGVGIWYCRLRVCEPTAHDVLLLLELEKPNTSPRDRPPVGPRNVTQLDEVAALSQRTYPEYVLYDDDAWVAIERSAAANLALSAEEECLLRDASTPTGERLALPLFINGRAGSGKTTMLWFLYAQYCDKLLRAAPSAPLPTPIYLTYSRALLDCARDGVRNILSRHAKYLAADAPAVQEEELERLFCVFPDYVLQLLPVEARRRFRRDNHIDFHRFRTLYNNQEPGGPGCHLPGLGAISADEAWHAIRSFIKGWRTDILDLDDVLTPEEYSELPRDDQTLPEDTYRGIFESIWDHWYRQLGAQGEYWDDQDLIREVLLRGDLEPAHTAVFCDEAQDFTRIETDLIRRLSVFSRYEVQPPVLCLPFAFGGDPYQTLSPTGFRWENLGRMLQESLVEVVLPEWQRRYTVGLHRFDLSRNYRSSEPIVKACNIVLLWRRLLGESLGPQRPWALPGDPPPGVYLLGDGADPDSLRRNARNVTIIVPVGANQLARYIEDDDVLREMATGGQAINIYGVTDAKGLEFDRVVVYRFGEACPEVDWDTLESADTLEFRYFLNRLYVALTRARSDLFIIDTADGYERLWRHATPTRIQQMCEAPTAANPDDAWGELTAGLDKATALPNLDDGVDPLKQATQLMEQGIQNQDPGLLDRALGYYERAGDSTRAKLCKAYSLRYRRNLSAAGTLFAELGRTEDAVHCFWEGCIWPDLQATLTLHPDVLPSHPGRLLTPYMAGQVSLGQFAHDLVGRLDAGLLIPEAMVQWIAVGKELERQTGTARLGSDGDWGAVARTAEELARRGYVALDTAARCYHRAGCHQRAVELFEEVKVLGDEYRRSKAAVVGMPEALGWLLDLGDRTAAAKEVLDIWETNDSPHEGGWLKYVAVALERANRGDEAIRAFLSMGDLEKAKHAFQTWSAGGGRAADKQRTVAALGDLIASLVLHRRAPEAVDTVRASRALGLDDDEVIALGCRLARELARSEESWGARYPQRQLSDMLATIARTDAWRAHVTWEELGASFERSGALNDTLRFYEEVADKDPDAAPAAGRRWVVSKRRQIQYLTGRGDDTEVDKHQKMLERRQREWAIGQDEEIPEFPHLPETDVDAQITSAGRPSVSGIPATQVNSSGEQGVRFDFAHLEIQADAALGMVLVIDRRSLDTLRIVASPLSVGNTKGESKGTRDGSEGASVEYSGNGYSVAAMTRGNGFALRVRIDGKEVLVGW